MSLEQLRREVGLDTDALNATAVFEPEFVDDLKLLG